MAVRTGWRDATKSGNPLSSKLDVELTQRGDLVDQLQRGEHQIARAIGTGLG